MSYAPYVENVIDIAKEAGQIILTCYQDMDVQYKDDHSPVTKADILANQLILERLRQLSPNIPIISEEDANLMPSDDVRKGLFWLVDPLDGTKSYIKKTGEFTVNIALIDEGIPIGGVVYLPAFDQYYFTDASNRAYKMKGGEIRETIRVRSMPKQGYSVVASKSHRTQATNDYIATLKPVYNIVAAGSSLKFCLIAEGKADIYPRFGRTMEWDTAAGDAVLRAAGGMVFLADDPANSLTYGKNHFENPHFIASSQG